MPHLDLRLLFAGLLAACASTSPAYAQADQSWADTNRLRGEAHAREMNRLGYEESQRAEQEQQQQSYSSPSDGGGGRPRYRPRRDPMTERLQFLVQAELAQANEALTRRDTAAAARTELQADPRYQTYLNGGWDHFQNSANAGPGEYCAASFWSSKGMITLTGGDRNYDGALLMFTGENVPKPRAFEDVRATLNQTGGGPATVKIFNFEHNPSMGNFGTLAFTVPDMNLALERMVDDMEFAVSIRGQEVFRMAWRDGLAARDRLRQCVSQRRS